MKTAASAMLVAAIATAGAHAQTVRVTQETCAQLTRHTPGDDVAYRPGQDVVNGRKVVPADIDAASTIEVPESFEIPITVETEKRLGIPVVPGLYKPEALIGTVAYHDGRFYFNDRPLQDDAEAALAALCRRVRTR